MKPCSRNRKLLAWLALGELDTLRAEALRAHVQTCSGCRRYLAEISGVTGSLAREEEMPDVQASEAFHRRLMTRLTAPEREGLWQTLVAPFMTMRLNWRVALPVVATAALVLAMGSLLVRQPPVSSAPPTRAQAVPPQNSKRDLPPTMANYQRVAAKSLDELDDLLTAQSKRNPSPGPIYTASLFATAHPMD